MVVLPQVRVARLRAAAPVLLALLTTAYGALLRFDALHARYGPIERPSWAGSLLNTASAVGAPLRPPGFVWYHEPRPYVGGDPINYLRYAREMQTFYQGHLREPVFLAVTKGFLWLLDDADVAISFASASASTLAIPATYLLGRMFSPWIGILAALGLAVDYNAVSWAPDGWRDDTFMLAFTLTAWLFVRFRRAPTHGNAVAVGLAGAVSCLTRITSVSFVLPGLALAIVDGLRAEWRRRWQGAIIAALTAGVLVTPYLVNCGRATGDPLVAINAHTIYYRAGEGLPYDTPESALTYVRSKVLRRPVRELDTAFVGLFVHPIENKWTGFDLWRHGTAWWLLLCAVAGLVSFIFLPDGRLLLTLVFTSLVPYAFTWNVAGGGDWRFTMHVYPVLLVAAAYAVVRTLTNGAALIRTRQLPRFTRARFAGAVGLLLVGVGAAVAYRQMPYFTLREAIGLGESASIETGPRDAVFFRRGWTEPHQDGLVTVRVTRGDRGIVRIPLPESRQYSLALRLDPVTPTMPTNVTVLLNRNMIGRVALTWNPERVGTYRLRIPPRTSRVGANELLLVADGTVPASAAGPRYQWIDPREPTAIRLWYVRVVPE